MSAYDLREREIRTFAEKQYKEWEYIDEVIGDGYDLLTKEKWYMSERVGYDVGTPKVVRERLFPNESKSTQDDIISIYLSLEEKKERVFPD